MSCEQVTAGHSNCVLSKFTFQRPEPCPPESIHKTSPYTEHSMATLLPRKRCSSPFHRHYQGRDAPVLFTDTTKEEMLQSFSQTLPRKRCSSPFHRHYQGRDAPVLFTDTTKEEMLQSFSQTHWCFTDSTPFVKATGIVFKSPHFLGAPVLTFSAELTGLYRLSVHRLSDCTQSTLRGTQSLKVSSGAFNKSPLGSQGHCPGTVTWLHQCVAAIIQNKSAS